MALVPTDLDLPRPSVYRSVWTQPCPSAPGAASALQLYSQTCDLQEPNYSPKFLQILSWSSGSVNLSVSIVKYLWHFYQLPFFSGCMRTLELCCDLLTIYCHLEPYIHIYGCVDMCTHISLCDPRVDINNSDGNKTACVHLSHGYQRQQAYQADATETTVPLSLINLSLLNKFWYCWNMFIFFTLSTHSTYMKMTW